MSAIGVVYSRTRRALRLSSHCPLIGLEGRGQSGIEAGMVWLQAPCFFNLTALTLIIIENDWKEILVVLFYSVAVTM